MKAKEKNDKLNELLKEKNPEDQAKEVKEQPDVLPELQAKATLPLKTQAAAETKEPEKLPSLQALESQQPMMSSKKL